MDSNAPFKHELGSVQQASHALKLFDNAMDEISSACEAMDSDIHSSFKKSCETHQNVMDMILSQLATMRHKSLKQLSSYESQALLLKNSMQRQQGRSVAQKYRYYASWTYGLPGCGVVRRIHTKVPEYIPLMLNTPESVIESSQKVLSRGYPLLEWPTDFRKEPRIVIGPDCSGTFKMELRFPWGLSCHMETGEIYLSENEGGGVKVFDANLRPVRFISDKDNPKLRSISGAWGVCVSPDGSQLVVVEYARQSARLMSVDGTFIKSIGEVTPEGNLSAPFNVAFDSLGFFYITDSNHNRVVKYTPTGQYVKSFRQSEEANRLYRPCGITVTDDDIVLVSPYGGEVLFAFDIEGNLLGVHRNVIGKSDYANYLSRGANGGFIYSDFGNGVVTCYSRDFKVVGEIKVPYPVGVALGTEGKLYIAQGYKNKAMSLY